MCTYIVQLRNQVIDFAAHASDLEFDQIRHKQIILCSRDYD